MKDLISIIVPIYNMEKYLNECLESIVKQTYKKLEIILVDDGSIDACSKICDEWFKKDIRVRVIHKKNEGVSVARNCGISAANGKWIMFVDADDTISINLVKILIESIKEDTIVISAGYTHDKENLDNNDQLGEKPSVDVNAEDVAFAVLTRSSTVYELQLKEFNYAVQLNASWSKLFNANVIKENNITFPVGLKLSEDTMFNLCVLDKVEKMSFVDFSGYYYRINTASVTKNFDLQSLQSRFELIDKTIPEYSIGKSIKIVEACRRHQVIKLLECLIKLVQNTNLDRQHVYKRKILEQLAELIREDDKSSFFFKTKASRTVHKLTVFFVKRKKFKLILLYLALGYKSRALIKANENL